MRNHRMVGILALVLGVAATATGQVLCTSPAVLPAPPLPPATQGTLYSVNFTSSEPSNWVGTAAFEGGLTTPLVAPPGLFFEVANSQTLLLSGTPTQVGTFPTPVTAIETVDIYGCLTRTNYVVVVNPATQPGLTISYPPPLFQPATWSILDLVPTLTGASSAVWTTATGSTLPPGLSLDSSTGEITGAITIPGPYTFVIQAAADGQTASTTLVLDEPFPIGAQECDCRTVERPGSSPPEEEVSTGTGELTDEVVDLDEGGGPLQVYFERFYSTLLSAEHFSGSLGANWMNNFETKLSISSSAATVTVPGGKAVEFIQAGTGWALQTPAQFDYQLVSVANGYQFMDPATKLVHTFSASGVLAGITDRNGNALVVTEGPNGPTSVTDGIGRFLTFSYASGHLVSVTDQAGRTISFAYTGSNLASFTDAGGAVTTYSYTTAGGQTGLMTAKTEPLGNTRYTQSYNSQAQVASQADSFGNTTTLAYSLNNETTTIKDARGNQETDTIKSFVATTTQLDPLNHTTSYAYDSNFDLTSRTDRLGNQTTATYLAFVGYPASITDTKGYTTNFAYTAQIQGPFTFYNLTAANFADGTSVEFSYDSAGNVLTARDQAGNVSTSTYNSRGQVLTATNPAGGITNTTYNSDGTVATIKDAAGNTTAFTYDSAKRPTQTDFADRTTASFAYDALDRPISMTDERGKVTTLIFDANGNLKSSTDPLGNSASVSYDTDDRVSSMTDPLGNITVPKYDPVSNLTSLMNAAGEKWSFTYDALNRVTSAADQAGFGPSFVYDSEGRLAAVTDPLSNTTGFVIDQLGRATQVTTPLGEQYSRSFDALGRINSVSNPLSQVTTFSYDGRGLVTDIMAPLGISASFKHDKLGLLSGMTDPNGNSWTLEHDGMGRLISTSDPLGRNFSLSYDVRNRLRTFAGPLGSAQMMYDPTGNLTQIQYTDGVTKSFGYDNNHRLIAANGVTLSYDAAGRIASSNGLMITRDAVGRITGITYALGKTVTYSYNTRGLLAQLSDWTGASIAFAYDNAARIVSMTRSNGLTTQYVYDADSRTGIITETSVDRPLSSIALQRDAAGKVVSATRNLPQLPSSPSGVVGFSYDAAEQVVGYSYDALGKLTQDTLRSYTWNLASELTAYNGANGSSSAQYDGFGMRVATTSNGITQNFILNDALGLPSIATVQAGGADQRYYVYTPGGSLLYAIDATGNVHHWYHFDETGTTTFLTDDTGQVTDTYSVLPYGESVTANGNTPNPFIWLGEWGVMQEGVTGLYYMRMRYYDSTSARFLSRDPVRQINPMAANPYEYASANPMSNVDPIGTYDWGSWTSLESWQAWGQGFIEGAEDGSVVVANAFTLGLNEKVSHEANKITNEYGAVGTVMKVTAGVGAAATYAAAGLAVAAETGLTAIGDASISTLVTTATNTAVQATGAATAFVTSQVDRLNIWGIRIWSYLNDSWNELSGRARAAIDITSGYTLGVSPSGTLQLGICRMGGPLKEGSALGEGTGSRYIPRSVKLAVLWESGGECRTCGVDLTMEPGFPNSAEFDHNFPYARGGDRTIENIDVLCRTCNRMKSDYSMWEFVQKVFGSWFQ